MSTNATTTTATVAALDDPPSLPAPLLPLLRPSTPVSVSALSALLPGARVGAELAGAYLKTGVGRTIGLDAPISTDQAWAPNGAHLPALGGRHGVSTAGEISGNQSQMVKLMSKSLYVGYTVGCAVGAAVGAVVGSELVGVRVGAGVGAEVVGAAEGLRVRTHSI